LRGTLDSREDLQTSSAKKEKRFLRPTTAEMTHGQQNGVSVWDEFYSLRRPFERGRGTDALKIGVFVTLGTNEKINSLKTDER